jgi:hypothetical protein
MRRWMTVLALAGAVGLAVTGCAPPGGTDGDLTDDWPALGEPQIFTPRAGTCFAADFAETVPLSTYLPVDCAHRHRLETVHVGTFGGAVANAAAAPRRGSAEFGTAYAECDTEARDYLGADWRTARLRLGVATPSPRGWAGGARWFRCDLTELVEIDYRGTDDRGETVSRTGGLHGALRTPGPLQLGCYASTLTRIRTIDRMSPVDCGTRHNTEFAGVWRAPAGQRYPTVPRDWAVFYDGCYQVAARYVEVPERAIRFRADVVAPPSGPADWRAGDRGVRCFVWRPDGRFTRSLKGIGPAGLPVRTR